MRKKSTPKIDETLQKIAGGISKANSQTLSSIEAALNKITLHLATQIALIVKG